MTSDQLRHINTRVLVEKIHHEAPWLTFKDIAKLVGCSRQHVSDICVAAVSPRANLE